MLRILQDFVFQLSGPATQLSFRQRRQQGFGGLRRGVDIVKVFQPGIQNPAQGAAGQRLQFLDPPLHFQPLLLGGKGDAQTELRIVFKKGIAPGRPLAFFIASIGNGGHGGPPGLGAARGIGPIHPVPEKLGQQLGIRSFTAAGAGPGELAQGLPELAALYRIFLKCVFFGNGEAVRPGGGHAEILAADGLHDEGLAL